MTANARDLTDLQEWWGGRSALQRRAVLALAAAELVAVMWVQLFTVQPVGPVAYLALGRRPDHAA